MIRSKSIKITTTLLAMLIMLVGCGESNYTLYRSSAVASGGESWRLHVASFDAKDGESYNRENCQIAQDLFQRQPGVTVKYWCEKGSYKK